MHKSFTGDARRPRNVNLSGRSKNPWANLPSNSPSNTTHSSTLLSAQADRERRQKERERLTATKTIQRVTRGWLERRRIRAEWRMLWDSHEDVFSNALERTQSNGTLPSLRRESKSLVIEVPSDAQYHSKQELISQLQLLTYFAQATDATDRVRMIYLGRLLRKSGQLQSSDITLRVARLLRRLGTLSIQALRNVGGSTDEGETRKELLLLLGFLARATPRELAARNSQQYFRALADLLDSDQDSDRGLPNILIDNTIALLTQITSETLTAYTSFATEFLCKPNLEARLGLDGMNKIIESINYKLLASALATFLSSTIPAPLMHGNDRRLWLLARFIYAHYHALQGRADLANDPDYISVISTLLSSCADEISTRINLEDTIMKTGNNSSKSGPQPLAPFVTVQIRSLVKQSNISNLLSYSVVSEHEDRRENHAQALATYALTLLRVFPGKAEDIRSWLFMGSTSLQGGQRPRISPIVFFWRSTKSTMIFVNIHKDEKQALGLLRPPAAGSGFKETSDTAQDIDSWKKEWQTILLFFELYTFILKYMDDEEFLTGSDTPSASSDGGQLWTKEGALPLKDVKELSIFLKHLAFTLYWNAADLEEAGAVADEETIRSYFATHDISKPSKRAEKEQTNAFAGVSGASQKQLKGLVTGLLRMIHERDSRRRFLPKDHWLMTSSFDMTGFIPAVVTEEEKRHLISEENDDDDEGEEEERQDDNDEMLNTSDSLITSRNYLIGTGRARHTQQLEQLKRKQERAVRRRMLESVAPRLEILRNLPFFIPFDTRVQIFRQFINNDQIRRRSGFVDPDQWRMSVVQNSGIGPDGRPLGGEVIGRHHADIERNAIFESAFNQFYQLGDGLKEPIQISFIDRFGALEAGIDGGGVTKEFITSVTNEAFDPAGDLGLFVENDQHLLYPNPGIIEEKKEILSQAAIPEGSPEYRENLSDILKRYEFLGRIMGKCMYEGILVDVNFAGFFLLKWALTGGTTTASNESAYKPSLNDLRDLDEGLYQGLLQLKNYAWNVEDFSLAFTITDTIQLPETDSSMSNKRRATKSIDHDLIPRGSTIPVTNRNRLHYIYQVSRYRLSLQQYYQTKYFLLGLGQIISPTWLSMFNQHELQTLISGDTTGEIDIEDLRRNTNYGGVYVIGDDGIEHPVIKMFWEVMREFSHAERRKVLKFVTSTPRAPLGGFSHLNPRFSIRDSGPSVHAVENFSVSASHFPAAFPPTTAASNRSNYDDGSGGSGEGTQIPDTDRLPSTSTCVNLLKLPRYRTKEKLKERLIYSIESGAGFDLS